MRLALLLAGIAAAVLPASSFAQNQKGAGRQIAVEVTIADIAEDAGDPNEITAEKLADLEKGGKVSSITRLRLTTLENNPAVLQFGERVPVVIGRTFRGGEGFQAAQQIESIGSMVQLTARVEEDDSVVMEFQLEQTRLVPAPAPEEGADASLARPRTTTMNSRSTFRVPKGKSVVAGSQKAKTDKGSVQTVVLVSAATGGATADGADARAAIKILALKHAVASEVADVLRAVYDKRALRIGVDVRTNSLIIQGDERETVELGELVAKLDQPAE